MRLLFNFNVVYFLLSVSVYSQSYQPDTTSLDPKFSIGAKYSMLHLTGNVQGRIAFSQPRQTILISSKGNSDPGIFMATESRYRGRKNLYRQLELGFTTFSGEIEYKKVGGSSIGINGESFERQFYRDITFRSFIFILTT